MSKSVFKILTKLDLCLSFFSWNTLAHCFVVIIDDGAPPDALCLFTTCCWCCCSCRDINYIESTSPEHTMSGLRHKSTMEEAINSLTSEMVRSCHMSSFYMKRWGGASSNDESMVRSLTTLSSVRNGTVVGDTATSSSAVMSRGGIRSSSTTTTTTVVITDPRNNHSELRNSHRRIEAEEGHSLTWECDPLLICLASGFCILLTILLVVRAMRRGQEPQYCYLLIFVWKLICPSYL